MTVALAASPQCRGTSCKARTPRVILSALLRLVSFPYRNHDTRMENSLPNITSHHRPIWSDFLGPNPLQNPTSSSGGTYIASGDARQIAGNINTTFTGPVEKVEAHYHGK
jgi:hypothetical protein